MLMISASSAIKHKLFARGFESLTESWKNNGPVVIGGLGGSGTRVVAEIFKDFGFFIGSDLNVANDNLLHTFLFNRPLWYAENSSRHEVIDTGLSLMAKAMLHTTIPTLDEFSYLMSAVRSVSADGFSYRHIGKGKTGWALQRLVKMMYPKSCTKVSYVGWGWKEPKSHLLINDMARNYRHFKYVHTIRHGLDMAFSVNQRQLCTWGHLYDVSLPVDKTQIPQASYRYWVKANREAVKKGKCLGEDNFLLVNFDCLCGNPLIELSRIADFLKIALTEDQLSRLSRIVCPPKSLGRYINYDVDMFRGEDLDALTEFGFDAVDGERK